MHQTRHKHGRCSYLSDGIGGDSQSLLEPEPLRRKDRGIFSYNIDVRLPFKSRQLSGAHPSGMSKSDRVYLKLV